MNPILRPARSADADACAAIYAPIVRDTPISFEIEPPDAAEMNTRIQASMSRYPWLVCASGNEVLGYAYGGVHRTRAAYRWSVEVSVYNHADHRRRGVARGLYQALLEILTLQGFHRAFAGITLPNEASVALHEGLDFTPVGVYRRIGFKCGGWHDVGWWERPLAAVSDPPGEVRPFAAIAQSPEVEAILSQAAPLVRAPGPRPA